jgi:hypothetical protein
LFYVIFVEKIMLTPKGFEPPIDLLGSVREGALNLPVEFQIPVEPYYYSQKFHVLLIGIW